jgi:uncharacterized membrane protein/uncharacterized membrane protein YeaQ/YmgE (transglycosylase-associated protein family)
VLEGEATMHVMTWVATGFVVGWAARRLLGSKQEFGLIADLVTGGLGGVLGGWLFRRTGVTGPDDFASHVLVALGGAATLLTVLRVMKRLAFTGGPVTDTVSGPASSELQDRIGRLGEFERRVLHSVLSRQRVARDPNQAFEEQITFGERVADRVALFGGSWTFIGLFFIVLVGWMALNEEMRLPFDAYPFILLNLVLSCIAALQAPVIMMSQNRQAAKDRSDARTDYEVNVRAELEIMALHTKLDLLREQEWQRLVSIVEEQQQVLNQIAHRLDALTGPGRATTDPC